MISLSTFYRLLAMITITIYVTQACNKKSSPSSTTKAESSTESLIEKESIQNSPKIIQGGVKFTYNYCGGAAPSDEMIKRLNTPRGISSFMLYIKLGEVNNDSPILDSVFCNEEGQFQFKVKPGNYIVLTADQIKKFSSQNYSSKYLQVDDEQCLKQWWQNGLYKVAIKNSDVVLPDTILVQRCNGLGLVPCMSFTGPLPPMMRKE